MFGRKTHRRGRERRADPGQSSAEFASDDRATRPLPVPAAAARISILEREEEKTKQTPWRRGRSEAIVGIQPRDCEASRRLISHGDDILRIFIMTLCLAKRKRMEKKR